MKRARLRASVQAFLRGDITFRELRAIADECKEFASWA